MIVVNRHDEVGAWVAERTDGQWVPGEGTAVGFTKDDILIAGVTYTRWNGANVWSSIASIDRRWCNRTNLWAIFHYPFVQLGCGRMTALVKETNTVSQRFLSKLGFVREATLADAAPDGDLYVYRLLKDDCKWLSNQRWVPHEQRRQATEIS